MAQTKAQVNKLLTNVSNGIFPEGFIADKIFNQIKVKQSTGIIGGYGNAHLRQSNDLIGGRAEARRADPIERKTDVTYNVKKHALEGVVTQDDYDNVEEPFDAEADETTGLTNMILVNKEISVSSQVFSTAVMTNYTTPSVKYGTYASADPLADFKTAHNAILDATGLSPNAAVMSKKVFNTLKYSPSILDILGFKYNQMGLLSEADVMKALDVSQLLIADAPYNSAKEGQADVITQIWANSILLYVKPAAAAKRQVALGYEFKQIGAESRQVYSYDLNNPVGAKGIIVQDAYEHKIVNVGAGYLLNSVL